MATAQEILDLYQEVIKIDTDSITNELKKTSDTLKPIIAQLPVEELDKVSANSMAMKGKIETVLTAFENIQKRLNAAELPKIPAGVESKQVSKSIDDIAREISGSAKQALTEKMIRDLGTLLEKLKVLVSQKIATCKGLIAVCNGIKSKSDAFAKSKTQTAKAPAETSQQTTGKAPSETKHPATGVAPGAAGKAPVATSAPATGKAPAALFTPPVTAPAPAKKAVDPIANQVGPGGKPAG